MAFLTGLQATLNGVLQQLEPEKIENEAKEKGRKFMGLNANAQNWQTYKEKQALLATKVQQNLNEVLSSYFADAYQAQINRIKDSNK
jgi:predicted component of type VI protein secretion system